MSTTTIDAGPDFEQLEYGERYYIQTAKNAIESLGHIVAEAGSNEDEAISRRAVRDGTDDNGFLRFAYDPDEMLLTVTGDGDGMTATTMGTRLKRVGVAPQHGARRGFFHRGIREVFLAMGGGTVTSIGKTDAGDEVISQAVFDPTKGMAMTIKDATPTAEQRAELGLEATGTRVEIPMARFAKKKPRLYLFGHIEQQIRDCVGIRPVLTDPAREVVLAYADEPPRRLQFEYPEGEELVASRDIEIDGQDGTFWARVADKPLTGGRGRQTRRSGILIRGERAAYEVSTGDKLAQNPAMNRVFGELRLDGIEDLQREADAKADDESQLVYKTDRSGLNPEHPIVEKILSFIDDTLGPLVANLGSGEDKKKFSPDMRRQLQKLAKVINEVIDESVADELKDSGGKKAKDAEDSHEDKEPPEPPKEHKRQVADGIDFARGRIFIEAGTSRTVEAWFDTTKIAQGSTVALDSISDEVIHAATLSGDTVPAPAADGIAQLDLTLKAGNSEGRHQVKISAAGFEAVLILHVRFPRASGFISQIIPRDLDWELGSALWNPSNGVVEVFVGRPEFTDAEARAHKDGQPDAMKHPLYRQLIVESVREAALWEAAQRRAEVEWDELPHEERQDPNAFHNLTRSQFQEFDYLLRSKLLKAFVET